MTRNELNALCAAIRAYKARADRFDRLRTWLEEQRDKAVLQTTKAIYQAVIDKMEEGAA